jgi:SAM-dependent methyltransferase
VAGVGVQSASVWPLHVFAGARITANDSDWAWQHYETTVRQLIEAFRCRDVLEIGGGRCPLFDRERARTLGIALAINDISRAELDRAPEALHKVCFDIAGPAIPREEEQHYDLIVSRMVMEHVRDAAQTYRNMCALLRPGGVVLNFHPVLYAPPFVLNHLLPESVARWLLRTFDASRTDDEIPKFPSRYSYCTISARTEAMIRAAGFSEVVLAPFYGHVYFRGIPGLREVDAWLTRWARAHDDRHFAAFCYALARR